MVDKIKVNLSSYVYNLLLKDMELFGYYKPNGDVNKNMFLNIVIHNFYLYKLGKREEIQKILEKDAITYDVSAKNREKILKETTRLMDNYYYEDINNRYHDLYFMIYPTNYSQNFFDQLFEDEIKNHTAASAFIRQALNEYAHLPQYVRETIANLATNNRLVDACHSGNIIEFVVSGVKYKIAPFVLESNEDETFKYLLGLDLASKNHTPISIRLSKINRLVTTNEKYRFTKDENNQLTKILFNGIEYASKEMINVEIELTKSGVKMLKSRYYGRPKCKQTGNNKYIVFSSFNNFVNYFIHFGKEIKILNNNEIKENMLSFYMKAYEAFVK